MIFKIAMALLAALILLVVVVRRRKAEAQKRAALLRDFKSELDNARQICQHEHAPQAAKDAFAAAEKEYASVSGPNAPSYKSLVLRANAVRVPLNEALNAAVIVVSAYDALAAVRQLVENLKGLLADEPDLGDIPQQIESAEGLIAKGEYATAYGILYRLYLPLQMSVQEMADHRRQRPWSSIGGFKLTIS